MIDRTLSLSDFYDIVFSKKRVEISHDAKEEVEKSYEFLKRFAADKIIYGINTGFGPMAQYRIDDAQLTELQYNIIRSHSAGAGSPLPDLYVRAAMLARLQTLLQAKSGVHISVIELLTEFLNREIYPFIPRHGSVGASGDLVQLAHIALTLIGEGKAHCDNEWKNTDKVLKINDLQPMKIFIREGLSITNGTSVMTAIGLVNLLYAKKLLDCAVLTSVWINEITNSYDDFASEPLNAAKLHRGQREIARQMREIAAESKCLQKRENIMYQDVSKEQKYFTKKVQSYYSLRCVPQVLGAIFDTMQNAENVLINELNSASDNPVIDYQTQNVYHGGNFHGDYVSFEMDKLKIAVTKLTMLAERQFNYLCHDKINEILPPFLNLGTRGVNYGLQAAQFTATSTTAENQTLAFPNYIHSIPNNNDNQDIVSMGTNSALIAKQVIDNAFEVMAIYSMALAQATDCLKIENCLSPQTKKLYQNVRKNFPPLIHDRPLYGEIEKIIDFLREIEKK
ncbi:MAG: aromatic amino acid ammonia-lyase [Prevotellaceae bacterium]|jgi:histidine ammonia-lyase|nr:aromatic amino acid ammonia-lyase [Prevotellaceae bacterium]